jgi:hypothetical protein
VRSPGVSDLDEAGKKLPMLQKFYGFPTTVIVDRNGHVRKIHTGFSGPATGEHYRQFADEFKTNLDQLLAEDSAAEPNHQEPAKYRRDTTGINNHN